MSLGQWYVSRGRITRRTFWMLYVLPLFGLSVLAAVADLALGNIDLSATTTENGASAAFQFGWVTVLVALATIVPSVSSQVTRLHDRGHSAWWLLFALIPVIGGIMLLVQTGFLRGDGGPNRYGPPPAPAGGPVPEPGYPQLHG